MQPPRQVAPGWVAAMGRLNRYIANDFGGGPRVLELAWIINFQKLTTIPMLAVLMIRYGNESAAAWIYFALQSSYGLVWLVKDLASMGGRPSLGSATHKLLGPTNASVPPFVGLAQPTKEIRW